MAYIGFQKPKYCPITVSTDESGNDTETYGAAKTFGKGIMQTTYIMDWIEQDALRLTTARILWPQSKTCIHDRGILASDGTKSVVKQMDTDAELTAAIQSLFS